MTSLRKEINRIKSEIGEIALYGRRQNGMKTKTLCTSCLCADAAFMVLQIVERMGWAHDEPDKYGDILVNVPIEDEHLFDFIDNCMCQ